jgi:hypothetical protein
MSGAARFRAAVEAADPVALRDCLAADAVFHSPAVHAPYQGRDAVARLLGAAVRVFQDFHYTAEIGGDDHHVLVFEARVGDREIEGVDIVRTDADGMVTELTVMLRPLSGLTAVAEAMGRMLAAT